MALLQISEPGQAPDPHQRRIAVGIDRARALGIEAERAAASVRPGDAQDVEGILLATRKADAAFRMLEAVRNAMLEAYAQVRDAGR